MKFDTQISPLLNYGFDTELILGRSESTLAVHQGVNLDVKS